MLGLPNNSPAVGFRVWVRGLRVQGSGFGGFEFLKGWEMETTIRRTPVNKAPALPTKTRAQKLRALDFGKNVCWVEKQNAF